MREDEKDRVEVHVHKGGMVNIANDSSVINAMQNNSIVRKKYYSCNKFGKNKKHEYIKIWNSRLFLHLHNDVYPLTLGESFIMPNFELWKGDKKKKIKGDTLDKVMHKYIKGNRTTSIIIIGEPGIGKTSIVSWMSNEYRENSDVIVLRFRDWEIHELQNSLLDVICNTLECNKLELENKILVIDGFDEIKNVQHKDVLLKNLLNGILDFKNIKLIITSRPNYVSVSEFKNTIILLPFNDFQIRSFYRKVQGKNINDNICFSNTEIIGIPVILYMAIVTKIDITKKTTKPELYCHIFAEDGGIFDKFSYEDMIYDGGEHILRSKENIKRYFEFLQGIAYAMFKKNTLSVAREEIEIPLFNFHGYNISILDFPIKYLFENTSDHFEFVHKTFYEYFISDFIIKVIQVSIQKAEDKEELAKKLGLLFYKQSLTPEIIEFMEYKMKKNIVYKESALTIKL